MSATSFIKGLVEEGIRKIIEDEVKKRLNEMFPVHTNRNDPMNRWGREVETICTDILKNDPEVREIVRTHMVEVLTKHVEKLKE